MYGAGELGKRTVDFIGYWRVEAFVETKVVNEEVYGKQVLSFEDSKKLPAKDYIYVVASTKYCAEIVANLKKDGLNNYILMYDALPAELYNRYPGYMLWGRYMKCTFTEVLSNAHIYQYKKIVIYGLDFYTQYIAAEIAYQCNSRECIIGIIPAETDNIDGYHTVGIPIVSFDDVWDKADVVVMTRARKDDRIYSYLDERNHDFVVEELLECEHNLPDFHHPELKKYKNTHEGESCFLIGNGPSLRPEDLEVLHENNIFCFGANMIYKIYNKTKWRPNFICLSDDYRYEAILEDIDNVEAQLILSEGFHRLSNMRSEKVDYVHVIYQEFGDNKPMFSDDIVKGVYWGSETLYDIGMQVAFYMGFKTIYMLGFDHSSVGKSPMDKGNHFIEDYYDNNNRMMRYIKLRGMPQWKMGDRQYEQTKKIAEQKGVKVYNATRGGKLEVFERVNFDDIDFSKI